MSKTITTIYIDSELKEQAKAEGINISQFVEDILREKLGKKVKEELIDALDFLEKQIDKAQVARMKLIQRIEEIKAEEESKREEIKNIFKDVPEAQNLTESQLKDKEFLMKLVDIIREKYNKRIGITDIKEYYKVIKSSGGD